MEILIIYRFIMITIEEIREFISKKIEKNEFEVKQVPETNLLIETIACIANTWWWVIIIWIEDVSFKIVWIKDEDKKKIDVSNINNCLSEYISDKSYQIQVRWENIEWTSLPIIDVPYYNKTPLIFVKDLKVKQRKRYKWQIPLRIWTKNEVIKEQSQLEILINNCILQKWRPYISLQEKIYDNRHKDDDIQWWYFLWIKNTWKEYAVNLSITSKVFLKNKNWNTQDFNWVLFDDITDISIEWGKYLDYWHIYDYFFEKIPNLDNNWYEIYLQTELNYKDQYQNDYHEIQKYSIKLLKDKNSAVLSRCRFQLIKVEYK